MWYHVHIITTFIWQITRCSEKSIVQRQDFSHQIEFTAVSWLAYCFLLFSFWFIRFIQFSPTMQQMIWHFCLKQLTTAVQFYGGNNYFNVSKIQTLNVGSMPVNFHWIPSTYGRWIVLPFAQFWSLHQVRTIYPMRNWRAHFKIWIL